MKTSPFHGVSFIDRTGNWRATRTGSKKVHLGYFATEAAAAAAVDKARLAAGEARDAPRYNYDEAGRPAHDNDPPRVSGKIGVNWHKSSWRWLVWNGKHKSHHFKLADALVSRRAYVAARAAGPGAAASATSQAPAPSAALSSLVAADGSPAAAPFPAAAAAQPGQWPAIIGKKRRRQCHSALPAPSSATAAAFAISGAEL